MATTWNSSDKHANITLTNGNLTAEAVTGNYFWGVRATASKNTGKWYWEETVNTDINRRCLGIGTGSAALSPQIGTDAYGYGYHSDGNKWYNGSGIAYGDTYTAGDVIGVALDLDNGKIWFSKNNVWQNSGDPVAGTGEAFSSISGTYFPMTSLGYIGDKDTVNFGISAFSYSAPSGFSGIDAALSGNISEDINVLSEFNDNWPIVNEAINVNSEFIYLEIDSPISEDVSVNTSFAGDHARDISEDASVNTSMAVAQLGDLSEEVSVNSEFDGSFPSLTANLDATLPLITCDILGGHGGFIEGTLPCITAELRGGAILEATLSMITAGITGKVGIVGGLEATLPKITASITGKTEILGELEATLPMIRAHITGKTGEVGELNVTLPMITADIQGYHDITGELDATLPLIEAYMVGTVERDTCTVLRYSEPVL